MSVTRVEIKQRIYTSRTTNKITKAVNLRPKLKKANISFGTFQIIFFCILSEKYAQRPSN